MASDLVPPVDLERMLWFKSPNSEVWLERRTNYTTSLAVMSMVGYILGLGDRHPSNIMLDRYTGKIIHIDFGDCFEVALHREKYPEKVPFRLTRMLVNALDVSGVDGNFRIICEYVIGVLRENQESLMAVLEAFVCDPLIKWRLLIHDTPSQTPGASSSASSKLNCKQSAADSVRYGSSKRPLASDKKATVGNCHQNAPSSPFYSGLSPNPHSGSPNLIYQSSSDQLNERALVVINRVSDKLSGWDFGRQQQLTISNQVGKLIKMATNKENLCQAYLGWVAHW
ncbi:serine/threonine-protein kinase tor-like [Schistocerca gregaria]|uniref:serine/threonine-protein kinase tor-like n=1 Tax=Schistocerca gregaria TaxID=7010 RepID=UPI00211DFAAD|nr:serine/threonine-protein kinase tor-like [Schistocerca gregaria]